MTITSWDIGIFEGNGQAKLKVFRPATRGGKQFYDLVGESDWEQCNWWDDRPLFDGVPYGDPVPAWYTGMSCYIEAQAGDVIGVALHKLAAENKYLIYLDTTSASGALTGYRRNTALPISYDDIWTDITTYGSSRNDYYCASSPLSGRFLVKAYGYKYETTAQVSIEVN